MVASVIVVGRTNLLSLRLKALRHIVASISLLAWLRVAWAPDELFRASDGAVIFLHDLDALTQSVISELAPVGAARDCGQAIQRIPFKTARAVTGHIAIWIVNESFAAAAGYDYIVAIRCRVAVHVRCHDCYRIVAGSDRHSSFKAVIAPGGGGLAIDCYRRRLIGYSTNWQHTRPALVRR